MKRIIITGTLVLMYKFSFTQIVPASRVDIKDYWDNVVTSTEAGMLYELIGTHRGWDDKAVFVAGNNAGFDPLHFATEKLVIGNHAQTNKFLMVDFMSGNVGIGTPTPSQLLHVHGPNAAVLVSDVNTGGGMYRVGASDGSRGQWGYDGSANTYFDFAQTLHVRSLTGGTAERITILANGNVGIGTANPGSFKLAVEGKIGARKVVVTQANWSDYVFHPSYNLRTLSSLETFIKKNQHLPDVPSADEVEKNGLDMGATQAALLRKIEELTLYMIEQGKAINQLRKEVKRFKTSKYKY